MRWFFWRRDEEAPPDVSPWERAELGRLAQDRELETWLAAWRRDHPDEPVGGYRGGHAAADTPPPPTRESASVLQNLTPIVEVFGTQWHEAPGWITADTDPKTPAPSRANDDTMEIPIMTTDTAPAAHHAPEVPDQRLDPQPDARPFCEHCWGTGRQLTADELLREMLRYLPADDPVALDAFMVELYRLVAVSRGRGVPAGSDPTAHFRRHAPRQPQESR